MYNPHYSKPLPELLTLAEQQENTLALAIHQQANQSEALNDAIAYIATQITNDIRRTLSDSCQPDGDEYRAIVDMLNDSAPDEYQLQKVLDDLTDSIDTRSFLIPSCSPFARDHKAVELLTRFTQHDRDFDRLMRDISNDAEATTVTTSYDCAPAMRNQAGDLYLDSHHIGEIQLDTDTFLDDVPESIRDAVHAIVGDTIHHYSDVIIDLNLSASWLANWLKEYYA